ncbi:MAG: SusE domain-containing protein, partial [Thermoguttaceae bacterium]|nr:SusE domain-containing protein [Thermoguttaceae bacterium]
ADAGIDLKDSETVNFTWSQPDYGFPAAVDYSMQVSMDGNFTVSTEEADADDSCADNSADPEADEWDSLDSEENVFEEDDE